MEATSQLLSNFKLFSKSEETAPTTTITSSLLSKSYLGIFFFALCMIVGLIYYQQDVIKEFINTWIVNLWLTTHLTPQGEITSTYVPASFSPLSAILQL
jgi:hypothetical protein